MFPSVHGISFFQTSPSLSLIEEAFILNAGDVGAITFNRASDAFDPYNITTASVNMRRQRPINISGKNYQADLIEATRTNSFHYSNNQTDASWFKLRITAATSSTDSTYTNSPYTEIRETTDNNTHGFEQFVSKTAASEVWSTSMIIEPVGGRTDFRLICYDETDSYGNGIVFYYDTDTETVSSVSPYGTNPFVDKGSGIRNLGDGLYEIWCSFETNSGSLLTSQFGIGIGFTYNFVGDTAKGVNIHHTQIEKGEGATSLIETVASSVTRAEDTIYSAFDNITGENNSNQTWFAVVIPYLHVGGSNVGRQVLRAGTFASGFSDRLMNDAADFQLRAEGQGPQNVGSDLVDNAINSFAMSVTDDGGGTVTIKSYKDGSFDQTSTPTMTFTASEFVRAYIGNRNTSDGQFNGWVLILYWDKILTNAEIESIHNSLSLT